MREGYTAMAPRYYQTLPDTTRHYSISSFPGSEWSGARTETGDRRETRREERVDNQLSALQGAVYLHRPMLPVKDSTQYSSSTLWSSGSR